MFVDDILKSNDEVMQVMAQYKSKVGDNPNQNGHASSKYKSKGDNPSLNGHLSSE
jgi:hypothetical protein